MKESQSEVQRDQLVQSQLDYWSTAPRSLAERDPLAWEAGSSERVRAGSWVWLVVIVAIALTALLVLAG